MMATKRWSEREQKSTKPAAQANGCFCTLLSAVPLHAFTRMAMKSGLPPLEQRQLCDAFKRLKG